jgi:cullin-associated NEDD8-dissociated protein 1
MLSQSPDIEVKKNALEALTSVIHSNWGILKRSCRDMIGEILNFALTETQIRPELIEEVDLGPFKHKVDNGLSVRKAAYQLLETLQDRASDSIDLSRVVDTIVRVGLSDTAEECVVLNLNILAKMSSSSIMVVLSCLDSIVNAFQTLFSNNLKLISSQQS